MTFKATVINGEARARHSGRETIDVSLELNSTHKRQKEFGSIRPLPWPNGEAYLYPYIRTGARGDTMGTTRLRINDYNCRQHDCDYWQRTSISGGSSIFHISFPKGDCVRVLDPQDKYLYEQRWENGEARKITIASR